MKIMNLVESTATLTRITSLSPGTIYKRLDTPSYGEPRLLLGRVTDVLVDGENAAVAVVEFTPSIYSSHIEPTLKAFASNSDVTLFPVSEEEWRAGLEAAIELQERAVDTARRDLNRKNEVLEMLVFERPIGA